MEFGLGYPRFAAKSSSFWLRPILSTRFLTSGGSPILPPFLVRRLGPWRRIALRHPHRPFHRLQPHLLNIRPVPHLLLVAQRGIEHPPFAEIAHPSYSEILIGAMHALFCEIDRVRVQAHQHAHPVA